MAAGLLCGAQTATLGHTSRERQMTIYRAVARGKFSEGEEVGRTEGRRMPTNVPYLVDNLWEFTRPEKMPSRRHALYASMTPALALESAMAPAPEGYVACRMAFRTPPTMYQLPVSDAKHHADIRVLVRCVSKRLRDWAGAPVADKLALAPLFLPGITTAELAAAMTGSALLREVVDEASKLVTFWDADQATVAPGGELFFELVDGNTFTLHPV
jgi:hypothetical protein